MIEFNKDNKFMPHRLILSLILIYEMKKMFDRRRNRQMAREELENKQKYRRLSIIFQKHSDEISVKNKNQKLSLISVQAVIALATSHDSSFHRF